MNSAKHFSHPRGRLAQRKSSRVVALSIAVYAVLIVPVVSNLASSSAIAAPAVVPSAPRTASANGVYAAEMSITAAGIAQDGSSVVTVRMPSTAKSDALHIFLNGSDVTAKFSASGCSGAQCLTANLGGSDGLRLGKNVFQAEGETATGAKISARARFDGRSKMQIASQMKQAQAAKSSVQAKSAAVGATVAEPFMAPTVSFQTRYAGGYEFAQQPWLNIGGTLYPTSNPVGCSNGNDRWTVIVFDRQTLVEKTAAPESSPRCFETNAALTTYLQALPTGDLVVAGTNYATNVDGTTALDTTSIGGTAYGQVANNPAGYMIIGATGASVGTAFEPHYVAGKTQWDYTALGVLQEDANGDYNFMSGSQDFVRFAVVPNAPSGAFNDSTVPITSVQISATGLQKAADNTYDYHAYAPADGSSDGFWLLTLNRGNLEPMQSCASNAPHGNVQFYKGCGTFYATNTSTHATGDAITAMKQLATDLNAASGDPWQLIILTTVGHATCCDWQSAVGLAGNPDTGYAELHPALEQFGGTPAYTTYGNGQNSTDTGYTPAYTLVSSSGLGNPLSGPVVESSTALLSSHGQTGTVTGTLERNNQAGLFTPGQINQEFTTVLIAKGGIDSLSVINRTAVQTPMDWPAQSQTQQLSGADSIQGQINAYRFISLSLLRDKYAVGVAGSHQDDLHYFFTGSLNTWIDYHIFDPLSLPWPGSNTAGFTSCSSVTSGANTNDTCNYNFATNDILTFTINDFNAVRAQTSLEVRYLTNVMQYFVTGSTNMRDSIIGGNANVGLALTGAAATILGNQLMPVPPVTTTSISWQGILGMVNGVLTIAAGIPGVGELVIAEDTIKASTKLMGAVKAAGAWSNEIAGVAGLASAAGSTKSSTTTTPLPAKYAKFALTVGQLASGALQDQLAHGFDAMLDSITSDWGRISTIGPRIVNVDDPAFFVPNQVVQEVVLDGITSGAERNFYSALMPSFFQVHYWPGVSGNSNGIRNGVQQPDMGYYTPHNESATCWAFYLSPHEDGNGSPLGVIPPYVSVYTPRPAGMTTYFDGIYPQATDYYLIAKPSDSKGSDTESITTLDPNMGASLFSPQGLHIPMLQFVHPMGPMSAVLLNAGTGTDITTHHNSEICESYGFLFSAVQSGAVGGGGGAVQVIDPSMISTTTTLAAPASALVGSTVLLSATVAGGAAPVSQGTMYFRIDDTVAASVPMQAGGTATYSLSSLTLGQHTMRASYGTAAGGIYRASSSDEQPLMIYSDAPDFTVTSSARSLSVKRGMTSSPTTISLASFNGAAGNVTFACSGLPMGATCKFAPAQGTVTDGGTTITSMTISTTPPAAFALFGLLFLPMFGVGADRRRKVIATSVLMGAVALTSITGCSGEKNYYEVPTGTVQVLVSATVGDITRTVPITVTISE